MTSPIGSPASAIGLSGLRAAQLRLDVGAHNIANAQTTRGPNGSAYQRQIVSFETQLIRQSGIGGPSLQSVKIGSISEASG